MEYSRFRETFFGGVAIIDGGVGIPIARNIYLFAFGVGGNSKLRDTVTDPVYSGRECVK